MKHLILSSRSGNSVWDECAPCEVVDLPEGVETLREVVEILRAVERGETTPIFPASRAGELASLLEVLVTGGKGVKL